MKAYRFIAVLALVLLPQQANAAWIDWIFTPSMPDFKRPYLEDGKAPNNAQWQSDTWSPQDWTNSRDGSKEAVLNGLINAGILREGFDSSLPSLKVGRPFLRLADQEKIHVVKYVDDAYGITDSNVPILIELDSGRWLSADTTVGVYTKDEGLQIQ